MQLPYLWPWPRFLNTLKHPLALGKSLFMVGSPPPSQGLSQIYAGLVFISLFVEGLLFFW